MWVGLVAHLLGQLFPPTNYKVTQINSGSKLSDQYLSDGNVTGQFPDVYTRIRLIHVCKNPIAQKHFIDWEGSTKFVFYLSICWSSVEYISHFSPPIFIYLSFISLIDFCLGRACFYDLFPSSLILPFSQDTHLHHLSLSLCLSLSLYYSLCQFLFPFSPFFLSLLCSPSSSLFPSIPPSFSPSPLPALVTELPCSNIFFAVEQHLEKNVHSFFEGNFLSIHRIGKGILFLT